MAGDWIAIRTDIHTVPEVVRLARITGRSVDEVVGLLVRFWSWAQAHTADGRLPGLELADAASGAHVPDGFLEALVEVGWLACQRRGLRVPHFDRWMAQSAKRRLTECARKRARRSAERASVRRTADTDARECPHSVRKKADKMRTGCAPSVRIDADKTRTRCAQVVRKNADKMRTRGEESTEQDRTVQDIETYPVCRTITDGEKTNSAEQMDVSSEVRRTSEPTASLARTCCDETTHTEHQNGGPLPALQPATDDHAVLVYPCIGPTKTWVLTDRQLAEWTALYPTIDVLGECRRALAWLRASPRRRRTASGMPRWLVSWLNRACDTRPSSDARLSSTEGRRSDSTRVRTGRYVFDPQTGALVGLRQDVSTAANGQDVSDPDTGEAST